MHKGGSYGFRTGEGVSAGDVAVHKVKIFNHFQNNIVEVEVPEDRCVITFSCDFGCAQMQVCMNVCTMSIFNQAHDSLKSM